MRRTSKKWISILVAAFAIIVAMAALPGCDSSSSAEGSTEDNVVS